MNENKLRAEVAKRRKQLKRSEDGEVPERTWRFIEEEGWLLEATEKFDEEPVRLGECGEASRVLDERQFFGRRLNLG